MWAKAVAGGANEATWMHCSQLSHHSQGCLCAEVYREDASVSGLCPCLLKPLLLTEGKSEGP